MAAALPEREALAAEAVERARLIRELARGVGELLFDAARHVPPPWPQPDPAEDRDEPAIVRKARRQRRAGVDA